MVMLPLCPWIKSGDRLEALSPWQSSRKYQYYVAARQMSWDAAMSGRMVINLERGFDLSGNPNFYAEGLAERLIDSKPITDPDRLHDEPGV